MSTPTIVIIVAIVVVVALAALLATRRRHSARLKDDFGPEYDRAVEDAGSRRRAEHELHERQKRVSRFDIRPLTPSDRERFVTDWRSIQAEFVDEPRRALGRADDLITDVMKARGYPVEDFETRSADLSVDHPQVVQNYRAGRDIALRHKRGEADTEDMRQAMIHYRSLFDELVAESDAAVRRAS